MGSFRPVSRPRQPGAGRRAGRRGYRRPGLRRRPCRAAVRPVRAGTGRGAGRVRAHRGSAGPGHVLRPVAVQRRQHRCRDRQVLPVHERAGDGDQQPPDLLPAGDEPHRRRGAGGQARRSRPGALATLAGRSAGVPPAPALRRGRAAAAREGSHRPRRLVAAVRRDDRRAKGAGQRRGISRSARRSTSSPTPIARRGRRRRTRSARCSATTSACSRW